MPQSKHGIVVLMGSGEMAPSMVETHKYAMSLIDGPVKAVFVDTPAGFQLNADLLGEKAVEFFHDKLNTPLDIVSFKSAEQADSEHIQSAATALYRASYIFAGPGSPTYAVRQWVDTPLIDALRESLVRGGCLTFASAAALTLGRWTIPVYEVYKVGDNLHWVDGLDILGVAGLEVAVVPHWNNNSGGDHDTRHCFMGEPRWAVLEKMLPPTTVVLGIDEHTACVLRLDAGDCEVRGIGQVAVRRGGIEQIFQSGESFSLDLLRPIQAGSNGGHAATKVDPAGANWDDIRAKHDALLGQPNPSSGAVGAYLFELASLLSSARAQSDWDAMEKAEVALRGAMVEIMAGMDSGAPVNLNAAIGPYIELLLELRNSFRTSQQWDQADLIRNRLTALGIILEDGPQGTTWRQEG